nr:hypothetical protein [Tanacetum cinerariifolium]
MVNATKESFDEDDLAKFQELLLDAEKPLYKGCPNFTKLSAIVKLLNLKGKYGASDRFTGMASIDEKFLEIAKDSRNLWLGISADGVDVNSGTRHHNVWLILPAIYNLPPWLCMKRKFIMLSVLISGYPGNDIDVFLEPLVNDLHTLFETGVDTYDASIKENFNLQNNVCEGLVETLLNVLGKTKDGMNARLDLAELGIKPELFARVSVEAVDLHISKEVATTRKAFYYRVLQEIWVLDYRFKQIPLFKCDWVNHKSGGVKHDPNLGYILVDLNSFGHKDDPFILASQARHVFYVKDQIDKKLSIVFRTPTKNYKDTYDEVDEEFSTVIHENNDNILPRVN